MGIVLAIFGIAFASFCIWLGVRIVNRRERWAKWTAIGLLVLVLVVYPLSFGPVIWLATRNSIPLWIVEDMGRPLWFVARSVPTPIGTAFEKYGRLWLPTTDP